MIQVEEQALQVLRDKARLELNEGDDDFVQCQIEKLRRLIEGMDNFSCPMTPRFLIRFLRAGKFDVEESLKMLQQYFTMRRDNPLLFKNLTPKYLSPFLDHGTQLVLKSRDHQGRHVFIFRPGLWNPGKISLDEIFRCNYAVFEEMTSTMETQINGIIALIDFQGFQFHQAKNFTPKHAMRMVHIIQGSFPCRFQEFHIINQPYIFNLVFALVKPFLYEKIRNRVQIHGNNVESLNVLLGSEELPDFMGGLNTSWEQDWDEFRAGMDHKEKYYQEMLNYGFHLGTKGPECESGHGK